MSVNPYIAQPGNTTETEESVSRFPDRRELLAIVIERAWIGVAVALVVFAFHVVKLKREVPHYRSSAVLMVDAQLPRLLNYQDVMSFNMRSLEYFNTVIITLHSRQMMETALKSSGLMDRADVFPEGLDLDGKVAQAKAWTLIEPVEKSRLINIMVEHPDPEVAAIFANAVAKSYIQQDMDNRMMVSLQAVEWLRERSVEYREKLEVGLSELQQYREQTESVSLEEDQNIVIAKLKALNSTLTEAQTERIAAESLWQSIQAQIDAGTPMTRIAAQFEDVRVASALNQLRNQQQVIEQLKQRYKPGYPDLQQAIALGNQMDASFEEECQAAIYNLKSRYETLKAREDNLVTALREQEQQSFALDRKLVRYNDLKRNIEADQEIYQSVISRMKETSIAGTAPSEVIRMVEEARVARAPFRPQPGKTLTKGAGMGVLLGFGVIFLLYYTDHQFRRNEEVERALGVPVLGTLPFISGKSVRERGMVSHIKQSGEVAEAFRTLRATLSINPATRDARVFMVTSSQPGEGKSLTSTNLAIIFAQDNRRTLLIGADLRRPAFGHIFEGVDTKTGLADALKGKVDWKKAVHKNVVPSMDVLPAGSIPSQPSELLGNRVLIGIMKEARELYDIVVIDAPPVLGVSDSLVLLGHADGVLFVVRYGVTHSLGATHAMKKIQESGTCCFGALMNGVNLQSIANYYYYRRYGGYAYRNYQATQNSELPKA